MTTTESSYHLEHGRSDGYEEYYEIQERKGEQKQKQTNKEYKEKLPIQIDNQYFKPSSSTLSTTQQHVKVKKEEPIKTPEEEEEEELQQQQQQQNKIKLSINTEPSTWNQQCKNQNSNQHQKNTTNHNKMKNKRKPFLKGQDRDTQEVTLSIDTTVREKDAFEGIRWEYKQLFGGLSEGDDVDPADIITSMAWNATGEMMAIGDQGGRIIVLKQDEPSKARKQEKQDDKDMESASQQMKNTTLEFNVYTDFTSHDSQFDYLQSLEIDERINQIEWCYEGVPDSHFILSTNEKCIKMWKIAETSKPQKIQPKNMVNGVTKKTNMSEIEMPTYEVQDKAIHHFEKRKYKSVHEFQIHSLSLCADQELFVSADDLRVNLWHLSCPNKTHTIVDLAPEDMKDLDVIITNTTFHPHQCSLFAYATTVGSIHLCDLREGSTAKDGLIMKSQPNMFHESVNSVSHVTFSPLQDSYQLLSRDYMSLKLWDTRLPREPVVTLDVHEGIRQHLADLYEIEYIFDKFTCHFSHDGTQVMTGSYRSNFLIYDIKHNMAQRLEASPAYIKNAKRHARFANTPYPLEEPVYQADDFTKKCLGTQFHPTQLACATATGTSLYLFEGIPMGGL